MWGNLSALTDCDKVNRAACGGLAASFFPPSLSLYTGCGIMIMMNYTKSVACGCKSQRCGWPEPSL